MLTRKKPGETPSTPKKNSGAKERPGKKPAYPFFSQKFSGKKNSGHKKPAWMIPAAGATHTTGSRGSPLAGLSYHAADPPGIIRVLRR